MASWVPTPSFSQHCFWFLCTVSDPDLSVEKTGVRWTKMPQQGSITYHINIPFFPLSHSPLSILLYCPSHHLYFSLPPFPPLSSTFSLFPTPAPSSWNVLLRSSWVEECCCNKPIHNPKGERLSTHTHTHWASHTNLHTQNLSKTFFLAAKRRTPLFPLCLSHMCACSTGQSMKLYVWEHSRMSISVLDTHRKKTRKRERDRTWACLLQ